jgi:hypothetical protein
MRLSAISTLLAFAMAGCATAPQTHQFQNTVTTSLPYDAAWSNIMDFFSSRNIQIKTIEKDSGIIYAESTTVDQRFADCGNPGLAVPLQNTASFNVFVRPLDSELTQLTVNSQHKQLRQFGGYPPVVVDCNSTGSLETAILQSVGAAQAIDSPRIAADIMSPKSPPPARAAGSSLRPTSFPPQQLVRMEPEQLVSVRDGRYGCVQVLESQSDGLQRC